MEVNELSNRKISYAAKRLGVSEATLRRWMKKGLIGFLRLPSGSVRIPDAEIQRLTSGIIPARTSGQDSTHSS
ncbi:MAG: helix-turn-helix domain-containing protein [Candidatus Angelobacter sp.]